MSIDQSDNESSFIINCDSILLEKVIVILSGGNKKFRELVEISGLNVLTDFRFVDMRGVDLSNEDLRGIDFTGSDFSGANLNNTIFTDTDIEILSKLDNLNKNYSTVLGGRLFGDVETSKFYNAGASSFLPAHLFFRARIRINQLVAANHINDAMFPESNNLEKINDNLWRITLWPINSEHVEWYITFSFIEGKCENIRIVRA